MKLLLILFLFPILCFSQHTEKFKALTKDLKKDVTEMDTVYHGNGKIDYTYQVVRYIHKEEEFKTQTGKSILYYRNGIVAREDLQDNFGNWLTSKYYDRSGNLTKEWITTEIDTNAMDLDEFFNSSTHINFKRTINYYRLSRKTDKRYKYKEEHITLINDVSGGLRNYLNENGKITRTKTLNKN